MSLMMSSCCTLRLKRRSALSMDSPSWIFTSAKLDTPFPRDLSPDWSFRTLRNTVGYHAGSKVRGRMSLGAEANERRE